VGTEEDRLSRVGEAFRVQGCLIFWFEDLPLLIPAKGWFQGRKKAVMAVMASMTEHERLIGVADMQSENWQDRVWLRDEGKQK
jgi:hypothetical protein